MMVYLYVEPDIRVERIRKRSIERFGDRVLEGGDMYQSNLKFLEYKGSWKANGDWAGTRIIAIKSSIPHVSKMLARGDFAFSIPS